MSTGDPSPVLAASHDREKLPFESVGVVSRVHEGEIATPSKHYQPSFSRLASAVEDAVEEYHSDLHLFANTVP